MYKQKEINTALRLYDRLKSTRGTIRILGYPSRTILHRWIRERRETGKVSATRYKRRDLEQKKKAVRSYIQIGKNLSLVFQQLSYTVTKHFVKIAKLLGIVKRFRKMSSLSFLLMLMLKSSELSRSVPFQLVRYNYFLGVLGWPI